MEIQQTIRTQIQGRDCPGKDIIGRVVDVGIGEKHSQTKRKVIKMTRPSRTGWDAFVNTAHDRSGEQFAKQN